MAFDTNDAAFSAHGVIIIIIIIIIIILLPWARSGSGPRPGPCPPRWPPVRMVSVRDCKWRFFDLGQAQFNRCLFIIHNEMVTFCNNKKKKRRLSDVPVMAMEREFLPKKNLWSKADIPVSTCSKVEPTSPPMNQVGYQTSTTSLSTTTNKSWWLLWPT